ncbi:hypothetical protein OS493_037903 [Desmophyllum pertusum]|uniref:Uncharacterized protein n=1 Tax=Desmophyllum pertusum TaxID=174260 RepID=A0A9W9Z6U1_9CNID|nr:hypothetical protein OS493_037903 [Desmophyllum pertusum]
MKVFIALSLCIALASAGSEDLAKYEACNKAEGDRSCEAGLTCVFTKEVVMKGRKVLVKQCMPEDAVIDVETVDFDIGEQKSSSNAAFRAKRFLFPGFLKDCSSEADCDPNFCCVAIIQRCFPKIAENGVCSFNIFHKCGLRGRFGVPKDNRYWDPHSGNQYSFGTVRKDVNNMQCNVTDEVVC